MKHLSKLSGVAAGLLLVGSPLGWADDEFKSFVDAVKGGDVYLDFRYRYEGVDQDGISKDAAASTLRSRLGLSTGSYHGFT
ncbi:MAG: hypothetical protein KDI21_11135, partial [Halieaceae bacterium]|nr:hypothetical protein [Halieaceae bacterium]